MYVFVDGSIAVSAAAPAGLTITDDLADLLGDISAGMVTGAHALFCESVSDIIDALEDGEELVYLDDDDIRSAMNLHAALVDAEWAVN